jgi:hypothetical protein
MGLFMFVHALRSATSQRVVLAAVPVAEADPATLLRTSAAVEACCFAVFDPDASCRHL